MPSQHAQDHPERIAAARSPTGIPGDNDGHNACLDLTQTKIIELLREVHLIAFKEIERLNMRIVELENQNRQFLEKPISKPAAKESPAVHPAPMKPSLPDVPDLLNEH